MRKTRDRSPQNRGVDLAVSDGIHRLPEWALCTVITVHAVADDALDDPALRQGVGRRAVGVVVTDQVYADPPARKAGLVERREGLLLVGPEHPRIAGAVVGLGREHAIEGFGNAHDHVTAPGVQRVAKKAAALWPPRRFKRTPHRRRELHGQLVFEPLALGIRVGQVVAVGADTKGTDRGLPLGVAE